HDLCGLVGVPVAVEDVEVRELLLRRQHQRAASLGGAAVAGVRLRVTLRETWRGLILVRAAAAALRATGTEDQHGRSSDRHEATEPLGSSAHLPSSRLPQPVMAWRRSADTTDRTGLRCSA